MPAAIDPQLLTFGNWTFRLRKARAKPERLIILMHGWMGDENSMWLLARNLSPKYTLLAPRGPFPATEGGYSWREVRPGTFGNSSLDDLRPAAQALLEFVEDWSFSSGIDADQFDLIGFSQGAAMTYALTLLYPERIRRCAALAGFIPQGGEVLLGEKQLSGKAVFVTHGRQDEIVPVEQGRRAVALLQDAGALVTYCESEAGHKVSQECFKAMETFWG